MNKSKQKGDRFERWLVNELKNHGVKAERTCLPAQAGKDKSETYDILIDNTYRLEAKNRANGFKIIEEYLGNNDFLVVKRDRQCPFAIMDWNTFIQLLTRFLQ